MDQTRLLQEIIVSLKHEKFRQDSLDEPDHQYKIETQIEISEREWCFSSMVMHNGVEISDDPELIKERTCRKRVAQMNKTKALWNLFIKEAATIHSDRCEAVRQRLVKSGKRPLTVNSKTAMMLVIGVLAFFVLSIFYLTRSTTQSTVLRSDMDDISPPVTPVALTLAEPDPVPPLDLPEPVPDGDEVAPPAATVTREPDEIEPVGPDQMSPGPIEEPSPRSASMDKTPESSQMQAKDPQMARALSPDDIKARVRSILENKTESP